MSYLAALGLAADIITQVTQQRTQDGFESLSPTATAGAPVTVTFSAAGQQQVAHKLGKDPQGYSIVCRMANAQVWDYKAPDYRFLYLEATGAVTVKLLVF